jgi:hypothetical protein
MIDFNLMIDRYLEREIKQKEIGRYYPSEIGSCLRKVWYAYKIPKETPKELRRIFEAGNILHDFVARVLRSDKNPDVELLESELPFKFEYEDFVISGRIDNVLLLKVEEKKILVEVKSCKSLYYIDKPKPEHETQLQFYMWAMRIHNGILLYIEKNTLNSKIFAVPFDEKRAIAIADRFKTLHECLKVNKLPPAEAKNDNRMNWMCRYCDWKDECDINSLNLIERNHKQD